MLKTESGAHKVDDRLALMAARAQSGFAPNVLERSEEDVWNDL